MDIKRRIKKLESTVGSNKKICLIYVCSHEDDSELMKQRALDEFVKRGGNLNDLESVLRVRGRMDNSPDENPFILFSEVRGVSSSLGK